MNSLIIHVPCRREYTLPNRVSILIGVHSLNALYHSLMGCYIADYLPASHIPNFEVFKGCGAKKIPYGSQVTNGLLMGIINYSLYAPGSLLIESILLVLDREVIVKRAYILPVALGDRLIWHIVRINLFKTNLIVLFFSIWVDCICNTTRIYAKNLGSTEITLASILSSQCWRECA